MGTGSVPRGGSLTRARPRVVAHGSPRVCWKSAAAGQRPRLASIGRHRAVCARRLRRGSAGRFPNRDAGRFPSARRSPMTAKIGSAPLPNRSPTRGEGVCRPWLSGRGLREIPHARAPCRSVSRRDRATPPAVWGPGRHRTARSTRCRLCLLPSWEKVPRSADGGGFRHITEEDDVDARSRATPHPTASCHGKSVESTRVSRPCLASPPRTVSLDWRARHLHARAR